MYPIVEIEFYPMVTRYLIISITTVANLDQYFEKARIWILKYLYLVLIPQFFFSNMIKVV